MKRLPAIALMLLVAACSVEVLPSSPPASPGASGPTRSLAAPTPELTPVPAPANPGFGLPYACAAEPFDVRIFSLPPSAETSDDRAVDGLRKTLAEDPSLPRTGWWMTGRSETEGEFAARNTAGGLDYVRVQLEPDGTWGLHSWGGCGPVLRLTGLSTVVWHLDPDAPAPGPDTRIVRAVVTESCVPDPLAPRLQPPIIRSTEDLVLIAFTAEPGGGVGARPRLPLRVASAWVPGSDVILSRPLLDHCGGNSSTVVEVDIGESLGDRILIDGSFWPGRDVRLPIQP